MKARLRAEGKRLENLSASEMKKRFFIDADTYKRALSAQAQASVREKSPKQQNSSH